VDDQKLASLFAPFGAVSKAVVIIDKISGRSKGYGFVEMENDQEALTAIEQLNGSDLDGRKIMVNEARPREERSDRPDNRGGYSNSRSGGGYNSGSGGGYNSGNRDRNRGPRY
jgi:RNA recognition motif-containing protein